MRLTRRLKISQILQPACNYLEQQGESHNRGLGHTMAQNQKNKNTIKNASGLSRWKYYLERIHYQNKSPEQKHKKYYQKHKHI